MNNKEYSHCSNCGYECIDEPYNRHPNKCPICKHSKDWHKGKTPNCQKCNIYFICHEPIKNLCPTYSKVCNYFVENKK